MEPGENYDGKESHFNFKINLMKNQESIISGDTIIDPRYGTIKAQLVQHKAKNILLDLENVDGKHLTLKDPSQVLIERNYDEDYESLMQINFRI
jgi:hypothetical protein